MQFRKIAIVSLALLAGVAIWLVYTVRSEPLAQAPAHADETSQLHALQQEVGGLRAQVSRMDRRAAAVPAASGEPDKPDFQSMTREERKTALLQEQHRAVDYLDAHVTGGLDPAWGAQVQAKLTTLDTAGTAGATVRSVACGTSLCRADLTLGDRPQLDHFLDQLPTAALGGAYQAFYERDGDKIATTLFVTRDGQPLPNLAKEGQLAQARPQGAQGERD
jgi:hypothetical protein